MKTYKARKERLQIRAEVLKALAHPTRLFILEELAEAPHCVCELTEMVGADISTVSKHLAVLKNAGLVGSEKKGKQVWYHLRMRCALNFLDCVETVLKQQARDMRKAAR